MRSKLEDRRQEIRELYQLGLSTTLIAEFIGGCTYGAIVWIVRDIIRRRNDAIALSKPPRSMKRSACYARARSAIWRAYGVRTSYQQHGHHKDGDITNNAPGNLEVLAVTDHIRLHRKWRATSE